MMKTMIGPMMVWAEIKHALEQNYHHEVELRDANRRHMLESFDLVVDADRWCFERFGYNGYTPNPNVGNVNIDISCHWARGSETYYFRDPNHALEFKLVWG